MRKYASHKDRQPEVRTKVPEEVFDYLEAAADSAGLTVYEAARIALLRGLGLTPEASPKP